jgi:hypothetical protein
MACGWLALDAAVVYGLRWMLWLYMACSGYSGCIWLALDAAVVYGLRMACAGCSGCIWLALDAAVVRRLHLILSLSSSLFFVVIFNVVFEVSLWLG